MKLDFRRRFAYKSGVATPHFSRMLRRVLLEEILPEDDVLPLAAKPYFRSLFLTLRRGRAILAASLISEE